MYVFVLLGPNEDFEFVLGFRYFSCRVVNVLVVNVLVVNVLVVFQFNISSTFASEFIEFLM